MESEQDLRVFVCNLLEREDYNVIVAGDGEQALQTAARHDNEIGLLVVNVIVPGFYGCHLAELLKFDYPQLEVIYLASFSDRDIRALGTEAKVILLQDVGWADSLVAAVRDVLDKSVLQVLSHTPASVVP